MWQGVGEGSLEGASEGGRQRTIAAAAVASSGTGIGKTVRFLIRFQRLQKRRRGRELLDLATRIKHLSPMNLLETPGQLLLVAGRATAVAVAVNPNLVEAVAAILFEGLAAVSVLLQWLLVTVLQLLMVRVLHFHKAEYLPLLSLSTKLVCGAGADAAEAI
jgi:hypothetical protein